jgi:PAS domain S-box-containing protein
MAVMDFDGRATTVNPAWVQALGHDEGVLLSTPLMELAHPDDRGPLAAAIGRLRQGERVARLEVRLRHADGSYRILSWNWAPGVGEYFAIGRDMTPQRLAEEQLRQAQKMEAVGQLTGGIAHDFNNLLGGIVGSLDLLGKRLRQGRTADLERYIAAAMTSAQRAAALTHRLLAFSRRRPLEPKPLDANEVVTGLEDLLRRTLGPAISLETKLACDLWRTACDRAQLESALLNLCINARDAMPAGGRLTVETGNVTVEEGAPTARRDVTPGQYVSIDVSDTGIGMSAEVLAHVLDPFFTTKPVGQGTGLGVPMVFGFAKEAGGHVRFTSQEGQGTTARIYLPRHQGQMDRPDVEGPLVEAAWSEAGETVLIVEDEPVVRGLLVEVLEDQGYRILEASDGPAGLKVLQSDLRIDLLIADIGLPGMDGRHLVEQARKTRPDMRALLITGYSDAALANGAPEPGLAVLAKPFDVDALMRNVRRLIAGEGHPG